MDLREILLGCNRRYLEYLSSLDDFSAGIRALGKSGSQETRPWRAMDSNFRFRAQ
jgi:hypothetical protein